MITFTTWRKSSRSGTSNGGGGTQCVEIAFADDATRVGVRDSKADGARLEFAAGVFAQFVAGVKR
ncbi:DUF397 domain-containing protein [Actinosynnema sp. NPDC020468]|uniref:DUF397 domain-containing protein n=1 Tax=Actinosynnema sp. NPDC020468 TaxID=3154488 RepID=UPI0033E99F7D